MKKRVAYVKGAKKKDRNQMAQLYDTLGDGPRRFDSLAIVLDRLHRYSLHHGVISTSECRSFNFFPPLTKFLDDVLRNIIQGGENRSMKTWSRLVPTLYIYLFYEKK